MQAGTPPERSPRQRPDGYAPPSNAGELLARYAAGERYFSGASLRGAQLAGARLWKANLSGADLTGADLSGAMLEDTDFSGADLTGANLSGARCHGSTFEGAILSQARLPGLEYWSDDRIVQRASEVYRGREERVFVSYSRSDETLVAPIVGLIPSLGRRVFMDVDSIVPGDKWRPALAKGLDDARIVLVFWCAHSAASVEVAREYRAAVETDKAVIPILLDGTPVDAALADYQWLDFRGTFASHDPSASLGELELAQRQREASAGGLRGALGEFKAALRHAPSQAAYEYRDAQRAMTSVLEAVAAAVDGR